MTGGVIDSVPKTNFPDIRGRCGIHASRSSGVVATCWMADNSLQTLVRWWSFLARMASSDSISSSRSSAARRKSVSLFINTSSYHSFSCSDKSAFTPEKLIATAQEIIKPYYLKIDEVDWFTAYHSKFSISELRTTAYVAQVGQRVVDQFSKLDRIFVACVQ